ncbi:alpha/beta hydrolase domain-containing protein [Asanoa sp. WMMD1127]|uniref:alpha/beta hydrolase domain-containing protein n=1 Tax=Asanoa sp. WMMD1127 TaxID=3016107 RepID=UPI002415B495|nr:alpha/beta hydrolase domain-containing protein [Asanoa sp. WMMD1127]MDG4823934.1 alpha/beta hydrolase domain-containing protein [Asanoa sp. WMMD1127]
MTRPWRRVALATAAGLVGSLLTAAPGQAAAAPGQAAPVLRGPIPVGETHPFFSTPFDLARHGYVEEEFYLAGAADGWDTAGNQVATDVPYQTRLVVRRPASPRAFSGTALVEWQNVTAGYDLDALWNPEATVRAGHAWVGVSAQRVGVDQLRGWSPARYGALDVTGGGRFVTDELSYDIFAQAGAAIGQRLRARTLLAIGASQSASRMTVYYDRVLPQVRPVFDGYGFIVGSAPTRVGAEPVFQVLSETDVRTPVRPADTDRFRRWEVAGGAHSGHNGQVYRAPIQERDLGAAPVYTCAQPPFSRIPVQHVTAAAYAHLERWVERGTPPPTAPPIEFNADGTKARDELGLVRGGIRLSQLAVPTALNTGDNAGESFCFLFGTHQPFDEATLDRLYRTHLGYGARVVAVDARNIVAGYLQPADAAQNLREALRSDVGR